MAEGWFQCDFKVYFEWVYGSFSVGPGWFTQIVAGCLVCVWGCVWARGEELRASLGSGLQWFGADLAGFRLASSHLWSLFNLGCGFQKRFRVNIRRVSAQNWLTNGLWWFRVGLAWVSGW